jgi:hypothetical protein
MGIHLQPRILNRYLLLLCAIPWLSSMEVGYQSIRKDGQRDDSL